MAGGQQMRPGFQPGGPDDPAMGGSGYMGGGMGWTDAGRMPKDWESPGMFEGGGYGFAPKQRPGFGSYVTGGPWTGGGGGFGPGLINGGGYGFAGDSPWGEPRSFAEWREPWKYQNGAHEEVYPGDEGYVGSTPIGDAEEDEQADPFDWGAVSSGGLSKAKEFAALGKMGRAKQAFTQEGGAWSSDIHRRLKSGD